MESEELALRAPRSLVAVVWREFVYGGHLLALGDAMVVCAIALVLGIPLNWGLPVVVYVSIFAVNSYNRYAEYEQDVLTNPERSVTMSKYMKVFPVLIIGLLTGVLVLLLATAPLTATQWAVALVVAGMLYTTVLKGFTRNVVGFKNFVIALPYAGILVLLPLYYRVPPGIGTLCVVVFYYLRILLSAMFFDIKDVESDAKERLRTFAVVLGRQGVVRLLMLVNVLSAVPLIAGVWLRALPPFALALLVTVPYAAYYILAVRDDRFDRAFLFNVVADGEFIFWLPYVLIAMALK